MPDESANPVFRAVEDLFHAALELDDRNGRRAYLDRVCGTDTQLREQVAELLEAHDEAGKSKGFLRERPAVPALEQAGDRIGPYTLIEQVGSGTFGVVWKATRPKPLQRDVALKIIKAGMDTRQVIDRFDAERQALALMDHPHIARVFDAGATDAGRPYFVMELVRGIRITEFCDQHRLTIRDRLVLFIKVCHAIQHAHGRGIIHRDIKPSNILVGWNDGIAQPKVIDFGIAKATNQQLTETPIVTLSGHFIGTPAYMSPEQAAGRNREIDQRSDVYSLGVLLYELLTGRPPFASTAPDSPPLDEILRAIRETETPPPDERLATLATPEIAAIARDRGTEPDALRKVLQSEPGWVILKCLEKDRSRRYPTVNGLVEDLQCYLDNKPLLLAGPSGRFFRMQKWVRRHKAAVSGIFVALALIAGSGLWLQNTTPQWQKVPVRVKGEAYDYSWTDIDWKGEAGWLVGAKDSRGGGIAPHIGHGIMLHTVDGGQTWEEFKIKNFESGVGTNHHFSDEIWTEIGPITGIDTFVWPRPDGKTLQTNGWVTSFTGIYATTNAGGSNAKWSRMTPNPDGPEGFGRFSRMIGLQGFTELYAVGWAGIAHWNGGPWEMQKKTFTYCMTSIVDARGERWAVGDAGEDEYGGRGGSSYGAIYHQPDGGTNWERVSLPNVRFLPSQKLCDITFIPRYSILVAVGSHGMILRASLDSGPRVWRQISLNREFDLARIACDSHSILWVVGARGLILRSTDHGETWKECTARDEHGTRITSNLSRIRIAESGVWITGEKTLLHLIQP